jgi:BirA family transcriptional regulator, biotin operon repressor / biotin---[acetyl-CoA-carboxylase] ligase
VSPPGNLYASTLVRLNPADPAPATLGFVAAMALFDGVISVAPELPLKIKWPNDLLVNGAKLSGILLERTGDWVVVGIGVNLSHHPDLPDRPTTSLSALTHQTHDPQAFVEVLARSFADWLTIWRRDIFRVLDGWRARGHRADEALSVNLPDGERVEGKFVALGNDGALLLRLADGSVRAIHAGDVFQV